MLSAVASFLRLRDFFTRPEFRRLRSWPDALAQFRTEALQSLDGFCFVVDEGSRIFYISETISTTLGHSQVSPSLPRQSQIQMLGHYLDEFVEAEDAHAFDAELRRVRDSGLRFSAFHIVLRMFTKLPKRQAGVLLDGFKVFFLPASDSCRSSW